ARRTARADAVLAWSSIATAGTEAVIGSPTEVDVSSFRGLLRSGQNMLAIHGLNFANSSSDMLIAAELVGKVRDDTAPGGDIRYTLTGKDPRDPGATAYAGPITRAATTRVKARALEAGTWSALVDATFVDLTQIPLRIT